MGYPYNTCIELGILNMGYPINTCTELGIPHIEIPHIGIPNIGVYRMSNPYKHWGIAMI